MAESTAFVIRYFLVACLIAFVSNFSLLASNYVVAIASWMTDSSFPGSRRFEAMLAIFSLIFGSLFFFSHAFFARRIFDISFSDKKISTMIILEKLVLVGGAVFLTFALVKLFSVFTLIVDSSSFDTILAVGSAGLAASVSIIKRQ